MSGVMFGAKNKGDGEYTPAEILHDVEQDIALLVGEAVDMPAKIETGSILWRIQHLANKALEQIKATMRAEGVRLFKTNGRSEQTLKSHDSWVTIKIPNRSIVLRKDADLSEIKALVGSSFGLFFDRVVTFKPTQDFEEQVAALSEDDPTLRDKILSMIDRQDNTPRISFRRKGSQG
jgi:hypothetical protein